MVEKKKRYPKPIAASTFWYYELRCVHCGISTSLSANIQDGTKCEVSCPFCETSIGKVTGIGRFER